MKNDYNKIYYENNKEACKNAMHEWYLANKTTQQTKNEEYFLANKQKLCDNQKEYYWKNNEVIRRSLKETRKRKRNFINFVALTYGCQNQTCKWIDEYHPCMLEFHHFDSKSKKFQLGKGADYGWETIIEEINKCVILCASCHALFHEGLVSLTETSLCNVTNEWVSFFKFETNEIIKNQLNLLERKKI